MKSSPLHDRKVNITVEYEFTTYDEDLDEDLIHELLENEPVDHVLSLIGKGTGLEWRDYRKRASVDIEEIG